MSITPEHQFSPESLRIMGYSDGETPASTPAANPGIEAELGHTADPSAGLELDEAESAIRETDVYSGSNIGGTDDDAFLYDDDGTSPPARTPATQQAAPADPANWINDEASELAMAYGIPVESLPSFGNRESFDAYRTMMDSQFAAPQAQPWQQPGFPGFPGSPFPGAPPQTAPQFPFVPQFPYAGAAPPGPFVYQPQQPVPQAPLQQPPAPAATDDGSNAKEGEGLKDGLIDLDYYRDLYASQGFEEEFIPALLKPLEHLRAQQAQFQKLSSQLESESRFRQEREKMEESDRVHDALDELDPTYYGQSLVNQRAVKLSPLHQWRRDQIYQTAKQMQAQAQSVTGSPYPTDLRLFLQRAAAVVHPNRSAQPAIGRQQALANQAGRVRPVGSPAGGVFHRQPTPEQRGPITRESQVQDLLQDPVLQQTIRDFAMSPR
jgi:hypothetical protein